MANKLISVRLPEDLLKKVDDFRNKVNSNSLYKTGSRNYYYSTTGFVSRADVIEQALIEYFRNNKI